MGGKRIEIANQRSIGMPCVLRSEHKASVPDADNPVPYFFTRKAFRWNARILAGKCRLAIAPSGHNVCTFFNCKPAGQVCYIL
jgi:hypothetical protein